MCRAGQRGCRGVSRPRPTHPTATASRHELGDRSRRGGHGGQPLGGALAPGRGRVPFDFRPPSPARVLAAICLESAGTPDDWCSKLLQCNWGKRSRSSFPDVPGAVVRIADFCNFLAHRPMQDGGTCYSRLGSAED